MASPYTQDFITAVQDPGSDIWRLVNIGNLLLLTDAPTDIQLGRFTYRAGGISAFTSRKAQAGDAVPQYEISGQLSQVPLATLHGLSIHRSRLDVFAVAVPPNTPPVIELLYRGYVGQVTTKDNAEFSIECLGLSHQSDASVGWVVSPSCNNRIGDRICGVNYSAYQVRGLITSVSAPRSRFTIGVALPAAGAGVPRAQEYQVGYVSRQDFIGEQYSVNSIDSSVPGQTTISLGTAALLPFAVGESIILYPQCDGSITACQAWGNVARFTGFVQMPTQARRLSGL